MGTPLARNLDSMIEVRRSGLGSGIGEDPFTAEIAETAETKTKLCSVFGEPASRSSESANRTQGAAGCGERSWPVTVSPRLGLCAVVLFGAAVKSHRNSGHKATAVTLQVAGISQVQGVAPRSPGLNRTPRVEVITISKKRSQDRKCMHRLRRGRTPSAGETKPQSAWSVGRSCEATNCRAPMTIVPGPACHHPIRSSR